MDAYKLLDELRAVPTVSGFEDKGHAQIAKILAPYFDEVRPAGVCGLLFTKKCGKENAKKILIDAHLDEIGYIVTDLRKDGLLTVSGLGGNDPRTYTAAEFVIHANEDISAVSVKKPYRMQTGNEKKLPKFDTFFLFTGYTAEELTAKGVKVGTPITVKRSTRMLGEEQITGPYMDDKCCAVAAVAALEELKDKTVNCDICLLFSAEEESFGVGFKTGAFDAEADEIFVVDVDLGNTPETNAVETVKMNAGPSVSISVQTDRAMTKRVLAVAKEKDIPVQPTMNVRSTGTNASGAPFLTDGAPCVSIGLPLKYMHTAVETLYESDLTNTGKLIAGYIEKYYGAEVNAK